ncbi:MAG: caspase family protein [Cyclobacteriaceae bacterium]|nr:caspase family protein [Cyclobacteriaceae bacterium]MCB0500806.1 caspase family protein [Cyclobacteriaceae bacterium]MCB9236604.1 caspase family protein [Flammeovirgaceae bacterium]MCO5273072.1 caspase family protein [Cyclobacteriaceae bacterium]MCW5903269.1 caspase family protein [Cyclobacteriaceae bacterium]
MKKFIFCFVLALIVSPSFGQEVKGKSNTVHLELNAGTNGKPEIVWEWPEQVSSEVPSGEVTVKAGIRSGQKLKQVEIYVNGRVPASDRGIGISPATNFDYKVEKQLLLSPGSNEIKIMAENESGVVTTESRIINVKAPVVAQRTDYALIIATNEYNEWDNLVNPVFDATTIGNELKENYGFKVDMVLNPTKSELLRKLREYNSMNFLPNDQLFIFIAGHGKFDDLIKDGYLVCKDSKKADDTGETYLPFSYLRTAIDNNPSRHVFLVMDACFGGTFDQAIAKRGEEDNMYTEITQSEYIAKKLKYKTRLYLTSGAKEYVPDGRPGKHSPFASKLIEALRSYGGKNKVITSKQMFWYVERVRPEPRFGTFGDNEPGSEFVFVAN